MQIITQTKPGPETEFEGDYIYNYLFQGVTEINKDKRLVVFSSNMNEKKPVDIQVNDVLCHLSNENLRFSYDFLSKENIVFRSYYDPFVLRKKCYAIPLGWQTGFANKDNLTGEHNKYIWCFIGQIKGYRQPMYNAFKDLKPSFSSVNVEWNSNTLSNEDVKKVYLDTAFALVPFGSIHADTMRIMEVLEYGCIPVVIKYLRSDYYKYIYGDHPFIVANNWDEAKTKILSFWNDHDALVNKQNEVKEWYEKYKINLKKDVSEIINGMEPKFCSQWRYQKIGRFNIIMKLIWFYHFYIKKHPIY